MDFYNLSVAGFHAPHAHEKQVQSIPEGRRLGNAGKWVAQVTRFSTAACLKDPLTLPGLPVLARIGACPPWADPAPFGWPQWLIFVQSPHPADGLG